MFALDEIQNYPVNWKDGMRVSAKDFMATDRAWSEALKDVRATLFQGIQFGLLPPLRDSSDTSAYPKLVLDRAKNLLLLKECRAITEGGYRIEITEDLHRQFQIPSEFPAVTVQKQEDFSVYITVDMFAPIGAGQMSSDAPPRRQYVSPFYELSIIYDSDGVGLPGFNHLKIAEYQYGQGGLKRNDRFLPACMTINAHDKLLERFSRLGSNLRTIHDNGIALSRQYRIDGRTEVRDAAAWMEKITLFIAQSIWSYNDDLSKRSPFYTLTYFKNLAQFLLSSLEIHEGNAFLKNGAKTEQTRFKALADPNFDQEDLRAAFDRIELALRSLHLWFKALGESFRQGRVVSVEDVGRK